MVEKLTKVGRLAMRAEGQWWNAYYALPDTMNGALHLGSIRLTAVQANENLKLRFMATMRELVDDVIADKAGMRPSWGGPETAPAHERAGHS